MINTGSHTTWLIALQANNLLFPGLTKLLRRGHGPSNSLSKLPYDLSLHVDYFGFSNRGP